METIEERLKLIQNDQLKICQDIGRDPNEIKILAVSKLQSVEKIMQAIQAGQLYFGENYAQEAIEKQNQIQNKNLEWHFIGRIQKNKLKNIVGNFSHIHSVDDLECAQKISQIAQKNNIQQKIFLQINQGDELSKGGFEPKSILQDWKVIQNLPNIKVVGLMTLPPITDNPEDSRKYFKDLKRILTEMKSEQNTQHPLNELSMGTSHDFREALEEGATIVRIGTFIFGARPQI